MSEMIPLSRTTSPHQEANTQFKTGLDLKTKGQTDAALTWFRRAAVTDPYFVGAHMEVGLLSKDKVKLDKIFQRYAYEAFQKAARLDLTFQEAHDQYIMAAQKMGVLDSILEEYEKLAHKNPDNELIRRCHKNIMTISMALITPQVQIKGSQNAGTLRKFILIGSLVALFFGMLMIFGPMLFNKSGKLSKDNIKSLLRVGIIVSGAGFAGILIRNKIE